jgi:hypothetical protein
MLFSLGDVNYTANQLQKYEIGFAALRSWFHKSI